MYRFSSLLPRITALSLALGGIATTARAQDIEIPGSGPSQQATVTVAGGGSRACLGPGRGTVFVRATGNSNGLLNYFMQRSTTGAKGSFDRIPFSGISNARQYEFDVDSDNRPDLFPGYFKVCATNNGASPVRVTLTLMSQ